MTERILRLLRAVPRILLPLVPVALALVAGLALLATAHVALRIALA